MERFNSAVRDDTSARYSDNYLQASATIDVMMDDYNVRLQATLGYIEPRRVERTLRWAKNTTMQLE